MKKLARKIVVSHLGKKVRKLRAKNNFKIIAVGGSIGKTSTKLAIAKVLGQKYRVQFQDGNYNDPVSVPLIFFGLDMPSLFNPLAWLKIFLNIREQLKEPYPIDYVVVEVATDNPGTIKQFKKYLQADLGVLTAITPEHMEYFGSLDSVAEEELDMTLFCDQLLVNDDLCATIYLDRVKIPMLTYAQNVTANYQITNVKYHKKGYGFEVLKNGESLLKSEHDLIAESQLYSICAATAVADLSGLSAEEIDKGIHKIKPASGRMQHLKGVKNSKIIDDTYNASPVAVKGALDTLYKMEGSQKIAILGNMNELGVYSQEAHIEIGKYCDPKKVDLVVTIGPDANEFTAHYAEKNGCQVSTFDSPYEAGEFVKQNVKNGAIILAKGSQNAVFAEEAVKILLDDPKDDKKLVRQSDHWLKVKAKQFGLKL